MPKIPSENKKVKISISIDYDSNEKLSQLAIDKKFYKKSRLVNHIIKKYLEENDN
jgi:metal-responsive CopG/Arc/MetJ family transcriptional regulator